MASACATLINRTPGASSMRCKGLPSSCGTIATSMSLASNASPGLEPRAWLSSFFCGAACTLPLHVRQQHRRPCSRLHDGRLHDRDGKDLEVLTGPKADKL